MLSKDGRNEIAQRIMKKLKDWPENDNMFGSTFKKFYWTKDYSHWAFVNDDEISEGFLVKP